jgi:hypothetical protein
MIPSRGQKDLGLMLQAPKSLGMGNTIPIPLKWHPDIAAFVLFLRPTSQGIFIEGSIRGKYFFLPVL